jgi:hypothetical protein
MRRSTSPALTGLLSSTVMLTTWPDTLAASGAIALST